MLQKHWTGYAVKSSERKSTANCRGKINTDESYTFSFIGLSVHVVILSEQVSPVHVAPRILPGFLFNGKNIAAEMLKAGWGVTYEQVPGFNVLSTFLCWQFVWQAGAEYGKLGKDHHLELENEAK